VAACAGILSTLIYLGLSGAPSPAIRSAITLIVAFVAILLDRRAIALRSLAGAAILILLLEPEAAGAPGFQMSFAATAALVALVEVQKTPIRALSVPWIVQAFQTGWDWIRASLLVSLVAGLATAPFAIYHFNRVSTYGLLANLIVAPISSFVIMPALAVGASLTAMGLPEPALTIAGFGLDRMMAVADWASRLPDSGMVLASPPPVALFVAVLGVMWLCLWKGAGRWLGLPVALAIVLWPQAEPPTAWVAAEGANLALNVKGKAVSLRGDVQSFALEMWARHRAISLSTDPIPAGYVCDHHHCFAQPTAPIPVSIWWMNREPKTEEWANLCGDATLIVVRSTSTDLPMACDGRAVLDGLNMKGRGSAEVYLQAGLWKVRWSRPQNVHRPWSPKP